MAFDEDAVLETLRRLGLDPAAPLDLASEIAALKQAIEDLKATTAEPPADEITSKRADGSVIATYRLV